MKNQLSLPWLAVGALGCDGRRFHFAAWRRCRSRSRRLSAQALLSPRRRKDSGFRFALRAKQPIGGVDQCQQHAGSKPRVRQRRQRNAGP